MTGLRHVTLMLSLILIGSCAASGGGAPPPPPPPADPHGCTGSNPGVEPININYTNSPIVVAPPNKTVDQGDVIQFNLVYNNNPNDPEAFVLVSTAGKTPPDGWINGSGKRKPGDSASHKFYVCVPRDLFDGEPKEVLVKEYQYNVSAVGHPVLDPIVTVHR